LDVQPFITYANENAFYFVAGDENSNRELWISDGSTAGTVMLDTPGKGSANPLGLYPYNGYLFYRARSNENASGEELWRSDGTRAGTKMVVDFWSGLNSSSPTNFCGVNNKLYFNANNGTVGTELYALAVTPVGTGISEEHLSELRVYPNPAKQVVWVAKSGEQGERSLEHGAGSRAVQFEMFDVNGRMVLSGELVDGRVDVSGLEAGMYILKVGKEGYARVRIGEMAN
jgi:ELWxxDGT repeat protein